uniref:DUF898 domain-containing protein n=1 Tax=Rhodopseudomonas palustris (strain BisA53) TaxID=316055 RepID=Q07IK6_RHOP5
MTSVPQVQGPQPAWFSGDRGEFRRLVMRGGFLEFVTLGFYRFWLATDLRRHLWANTSVDGDAVEYTGSAKELLIGFLIALAILAPLYVGYFLLGLEAESWQAFASTPLVVLLYLFGQFAIYRARRYRLTRTVWRGVRFWMTGSGWAYALRAALWGLAMGLTLGLIMPWRNAALERYKMGHSHYGELQGRFEGRGGELFKRGWWIWALGVLSIVAVPFVPLLGIVALIALPFLYAAYKAIEWRWWVSGLRIGEVRFESALPRKAFVGLYWKVIGWGVLLMIGLGLYLGFCVQALSWVSGLSPEAFFKPSNLLDNVPLLACTGVGYLALMLGLSVVIRIYLLRDLWAAVVTSTVVHGLAAAAEVAAKGELASAVGEGFADGLDVAGF